MKVTWVRNNDQTGYNDIMVYRTVDVQHDQIIFGNGYYCTGTTQNAADNGRAIPMKIYGIKGVR